MKKQILTSLIATLSISALCALQAQQLTQEQRRLQTMLSGTAEKHIPNDVMQLIGRFAAKHALKSELLEGVDSSIIFRLAFAKNSDRLMSLFSNGKSKIWNTHTGQCLHIFAQHQSTIRHLALSPDSQLAATASQETLEQPPRQRCYIWKIETGTIIDEITKPLTGALLTSIRPLAFSHNSKILAYQSPENKHIHLRNINSKQETILPCMETVQVAPSSARFIGDNIFAVQTLSNTVQFWDIQMAQLKASITKCQRIAFTSDQKTCAVAMGNIPEPIKLYGTQNYTLLRSFENSCNNYFSIECGPENHTILTVSCDKYVRLWDSRTGICLKEIQLEIPEYMNGISAHFTCDDDVIAVLIMNRGFMLIDLTTDTVVLTKEGPWCQLTINLDGTLIMAGQNNTKVIYHDQLPSILLFDIAALKQTLEYQPKAQARKKRSVFKKGALGIATAAITGFALKLLWKTYNASKR